eukprot:g6161.t1
MGSSELERALLEKFTGSRRSSRHSTLLARAGVAKERLMQKAAMELEHCPEMREVFLKELDSISHRLQHSPDLREESKKSDLRGESKNSDLSNREENSSPLPSLDNKERDIGGMMKKGNVEFDAVKGSWSKNYSKSNNQSSSIENDVRTTLEPDYFRTNDKSEVEVPENAWDSIHECWIQSQAMVEGGNSDNNDREPT